MKKVFFAIAVLLVFLASCSKDEGNEVTPSPEPTPEPVPYFSNNPLPVGKESVRVLAIGNSYSIDALTYAWTILHDAGLDTERYSIYITPRAGASLEFWSEQYKNDSEQTIYKYAGNLQMPLEKGSLRQLLNQDWDVVVIQQNAANQADYTTYQPYIRQLIDGIRASCTNPKVAIAYQMSWSYASTYAPELNPEEEWEKIRQAAERVRKEDGIDIIIPCGTAIRNARHSDLQTELDLTRDGRHLAYGVGRYIASICWLNTIMSPIFNLNLYGTPSFHHCARYEEEKNDSFPAAIDVTEENYLLCQQCGIVESEE